MHEVTEMNEIKKIVEESNSLTSDIYFFIKNRFEKSQITQPDQIMIIFDALSTIMIAFSKLSLPSQTIKEILETKINFIYDEFDKNHGEFLEILKNKFNNK